MAMNIKNLAAFDTAIRTACPAIDGVAADGHVFFQKTSTPTQIAAANAAVAAYTDPPEAQILDVNALAALLVTQGLLTAQDLASVHKAPPPLVVIPTISTSTVSIGPLSEVLTP